MSQRNVLALLLASALMLSSCGSTYETELHKAHAGLDEQTTQFEVEPTATPNTEAKTTDTLISNVTSDNVTAIHFGAFSGSKEGFQQAALAFQEDNPDVSIEVVGNEVLENNYDSETLASHVDCFVSNNVGADMGTTTLDLQPLIDTDTSFPHDDYPSGFLALFQDSSIMRGLPYIIEFDVLVYNQTAFEAAGLETPQIDWTMDDFLSTAEQLDSGQNENRRYGFAIVGSQASEALSFFEATGASLTTQNEEDSPNPNFTDPHVIKAAQSFVDLITKYTPHVKLQGYTSQLVDEYDFQQPLAEGRVGMWLGGGFSFPTTHEFTIAMAPKPLGDRTISANDFSATGLFISAQAEQPDACWRWIKYLSTEMPDTTYNRFPARRSVLESDAFAAWESSGKFEVYEAYGDALERTSNDNTTSGRPIEYYWFFQALDRAIQGEDLEQALTDAQLMTEGYIACAQQNNNDHDGSCLIQVDPDYDGTSILSTPVPEDEP